MYFRDMETRKEAVRAIFIGKDCAELHFGMTGWASETVINNQQFWSFLPNGFREVTVVCGEELYFPVS